MEIKLQRMTLRNFKSIRSLDFDFRGEDAIVSGSNGTGKTTLVKRFDKGEFSEKITNTKEG